MCYVLSDFSPQQTCHVLLFIHHQLCLHAHIKYSALQGVSVSCDITFGCGSRCCREHFLFKGETDLKLITRIGSETQQTLLLIRQANRIMLLSVHVTQKCPGKYHSVSSQCPDQFSSYLDVVIVHKKKWSDSVEEIPVKGFLGLDKGHMAHYYY